MKIVNGQKICTELNDVVTKYTGREMEKLPLVSKAQVQLLIAYKDCYATFKKYCIGLYAIVRFCKNNKSIPVLFSSIIKQKKLLYIAKSTIKKYALTPEEIKLCNSELENFTSRIPRIQKIINENLIMTEFFPYYKYLDENNDDIILDIAEKRIDNLLDGNDDIIDILIKNSRKYNEEHPEIYAAHLIVMNEAIETYNKAKERRKNLVMEEKRQIAEEKKIQKEICSEIEKNRKSERARDRKLGICGNSYHYKKRRVYPI